jgi:hypothetical protein
MLYFKMLNSNEGILQSLATINARISTIYKPGEITYPKVKGTPLFVFGCDSYDQISNVALAGSYIWSCEIGPVFERSYRCNAAQYELFSDLKLKKFWAGEYGEQYRVKLTPEDGVVLTEWVKLLRCIGRA